MLIEIAHYFVFEQYTSHCIRQPNISESSELLHSEIRQELRLLENIIFIYVLTWVPRYLFCVFSHVDKFLDILLHYLQLTKISYLKNVHYWGIKIKQYLLTYL